MGMEKRIEILFKGQVQGVGFRFTADQLAHKFDVKGYVENLRSGDVRVVAEGEEKELTAYLYAIRNSSVKDFILDFDCVWTESQGEFSDFSIRRTTR